jgi:methyltransferase
MSLAQWIVLLVAFQRLGELLLAKRNTARLLAAGGQEYGRIQYPFFVLLHGSWLIVLFVAAAPITPINWPLIGFFVILQASRVWVIAVLGRYWTTRIISIADAPLVRRGPYRWCRHPNYLIVALEVTVLPLAFGAWQLALLFTCLNLPLLIWRIRVEDGVIATRKAA